MTNPLSLMKKNYTMKRFYEYNMKIIPSFGEENANPVKIEFACYAPSINRE